MDHKVPDIHYENADINSDWSKRTGINLSIALSPRLVHCINLCFTRFDIFPINRSIIFKFHGTWILFIDKQAKVKGCLTMY